MPEDEIKIDGLEEMVYIAEKVLRFNNQNKK